MIKYETMFVRDYLAAGKRLFNVRNNAGHMSRRELREMYDWLCEPHLEVVFSSLYKEDFGKIDFDEFDRGIDFYLVGETAVFECLLRFSENILRIAEGIPNDKQVDWKDYYVEP